MLYRGEKEKKKWSIRYPIEASADQAEVRTLLMKLDDLKALAFVDPGPQHDEPVKTAHETIHQTHGVCGWRRSHRQTLSTRSGQRRSLCRDDPDAPIYRINPTIVKDLTRELFTLQDKRLLGMDGDDIAMLEVKTRETHYTLIRQNNVWVLEDAPTKTLDQEKVALFVSRVRRSPRQKFGSSSKPGHWRRMD